MGDLRPDIGAWIKLERALVRGKNAVDGYISIGMAVETDVGAVNALGPGVQVLLGLREIAMIGRRDVFIGCTDGHGAFGKRAVDGVLGGSAEADVLVAKAGFNAVTDHRFEQLSLGFVADAVQQSAANALLLHAPGARRVHYGGRSSAHTGRTSAT